LKKLLCFLLIIFIASNQLVFAIDNDETDYNERVYKEAAEVLETLRILEGYSSNGVDFENGITRAEFVNATVRALVGNSGNYNISDNNENASTQTFSDVPKSSWYASNIEKAVCLGIVTGYSDGKFYPDNIVTYNDALKILVSAAGYSIEAEKKGGFPTGYSLVASQLKLDTGIRNNIINSFYKADATLMIFNFLDVEPISITSINKEHYSFNKDYSGSILNKSHNIYIVKGIIFGTEKTQLSSKNGLGKGEIMITETNNNNYLFHVGSTLAEEYLGQDVKAYYKYDKNSSEQELVCVIPTIKNSVLNIEGKNITGYIEKDRKLYYDEKTVLSRRKTITESNYIELPGFIDIIYNGVYLEDYSAAYDVLNHTENINIDNVRLIDSNKDGKYETMLLTAYSTAIVQSINATTEKINFIDPISNIDLSNYDEYVLESDISPKFKLNNIKEGYVLALFEDTDKKYMKIVVSNSNITGRIENINDELIYVATINGKEYALSQSIADKKDNLQINEDYIFYLDHCNRIVGYRADISKNNIGYILKCYAGKGLDARLEFSIFNIDNTKLKLKTASSFYVDEDKKTSVNDEIAAKLAFKLVRYSLNSKGEISRIETPSTNQTGDKLAYSIGGSNKLLNLFYKSNTRTFYNNDKFYAFDSNSVIIRVPKNNDLAFPEDICDIISEKTLVNDDYYTVEGYSLQENSITSDIIILYSDGDTPITYKSPIIAVNSVSKSINNQEIVCKQITGIEDGVVKTYKSLSSDFVDSEGVVVELDEGDIIRFSTDFYGNCNCVKVILDYSNISSFSSLNPTNYSTTEHRLLGSVLKADNANAVIIRDMIINEDTIHDYEIQNISKAKICKYDPKARAGQKWRVGSVTDIIPYISDSYNYTKVLLSTRSAEPGYLFIIN